MSRFRRHTEQSKFPAQELVTTGVDMLESVVCYISLWCGARRDGSMVSVYECGCVAASLFSTLPGLLYIPPLTRFDPNCCQSQNRI